jgi:signal peptidase I
MSDRSSKPSAKEALWENLKVLAIALVIAFLVRTFIAEPRYIPSESMVPTLQVNDRLIIEKVSYLTQPPKTGDIIVFQPPEIPGRATNRNDVFIKRIIGVPGDRIVIQAGKVNINGVDRKEPYIQSPPEYNCPSDQPIPPLPRSFCYDLSQIQGVKEGRTFQVPSDQYFMMGDNRNNSTDSHVWGFLPKQNIIGRAWVRFFPFDRLGFF